MLKLLIYAERHDEIEQAIQREKLIKHSSREWKINLILESNLGWQDMYETLA